jgi:hypothetical protein
VVSPNGQWLIVVTQEKRVRLYDIQKGEKERCFESRSFPLSLVFNLLASSDLMRFLLASHC